jgi:hypothetical protein
MDSTQPTDSPAQCKQNVVSHEVACEFLGHLQHRKWKAYRRLHIHTPRHHQYFGLNHLVYQQQIVQQRGKQMIARSTVPVKTCRSPFCSAVCLAYKLSHPISSQARDCHQCQATLSPLQRHVCMYVTQRHVPVFLRSKSPGWSTAP